MLHPAQQLHCTAIHHSHTTTPLIGARDTMDSQPSWCQFTKHLTGQAVISYPCLTNTSKFSLMIKSNISAALSTEPDFCLTDLALTNPHLKSDTFEGLGVLAAERASMLLTRNFYLISQGVQFIDIKLSSATPQRTLACFLMGCFTVPLLHWREQ